MRQTTGTRRSPGEKIVKDIKRATRKHYSSEEKIRIVLDGLRGDNSAHYETSKNVVLRGHIGTRDLLNAIWRPTRRFDKVRHYPVET